MTQALLNNINNIEEVFAKTQKEFSQKEPYSGMDKGKNFQTVIDKKMSQINNNKEIKTTNDIKNNQQEIKTLKDLKENISTELTNSTNKISNLFKECKELIETATEEANIENSLDITLTRNINELISDLQEKSDYIQTEEIIPTEQEIESSEDTIVNEVVENTTNSSSEDLTLQNLILIPESLKNDEKSSLETDLDFEKNDITFSNIINSSNIIDESNSINNAEKIVENIEFIESEINNTVKPKVENETDLKEIIDENLIEDLNVESVEVEVDSQTTGNNNNSFLNQTAEEHSIKTLISTGESDFDLNIEKVVDSSKVVNTHTQTKPAEIASSRIIEQITKQMETLTNNSKVNIVLNPESLGKVSIQLIRTGEGLAAQFTVNSQEVKDMLMKGLDGLKESLMSHGVGVDNVTVKVNDSQKSEYNADYTEQEGSKGGNKQQDKSNKEEKEKGLFEQMMSQRADDENGNV